MDFFYKNDIIDSKFEVLFAIHKTTYGESYRVKELTSGKLYMLKVYVKEQLNPQHYDHDGMLKESAIHMGIDHPNISKFHSIQEIQKNGKSLFYYVVDFISGETLKERVDRDSTPTYQTALHIMEKVIDAVNYLGSNNPPIFHGDITPLNIMLDYSNGTNPVLIDFGIAKRENESVISYNNSLPSMFFIASEQLSQNIINDKTEQFSLGCLFYYLLTGLYPWSEYVHLNAEKHSINSIIESRNKPLKFPSNLNIDQNLKNIIIRALLPEPNQRFSNLDSFLESLKNRISTSTGSKSNVKKEIATIKRGEGFKKIAGMGQLKEDIQFEVIDPLLNPDDSAGYGIESPNAILFFGPPGCGKTFFAECLTEEVGFNFIKITPSDVASTYIHGTQEKIKEIFKSARENAPTILFLDEVDAMMPNRSGNLNNHSYESEVNEWLIQMNNCAKDKIFIIGATNFIAKLDSAVLRAGRFDRKIFIGLPDFELRKSLFEIELKKREAVLSDGINYEQLAIKTEGFSCADISLIVMDAARNAYRKKVKIDQEILLEIISNSSPSVDQAELDKYQKEKNSEKRNLIGFNR